ncbi:MAG: PAS domain S-box protein [Saprospiraceae bacterium]
MANNTWDFYLNQFENKILNAGIDESLSLSEQRIVKFINIGAIISGLFCILVLLLSIFIVTDSKVILSCLVFSIIYFIIPFINRLKRFFLTKLIALLFFSSAIIFWNLYISDTPYFLILPFVITSIFYDKNVFRIIGFVVFFSIFLQLKYYPFSSDDISYIFYDFCLFFAVLVLLGFTHQSFQKYERKMNDLNESLIAQNEVLAKQQQLKKSEQFFRSIFENNYLGIIVIGIESEFKRVNPAFCKQLGLEESYILQQKLIDFNLDKKIVPEKFIQLIKGEIKHFESQERFRRSDGNVMNAQLIVNGVYDINGHFVEAIITIQDVTETSQAQEALKESELKFRSLFDNSPLGITIRNIETDEIVEINACALNSLGLTKEAFYSLQKEKLIGPSTDLEKDKAIIQKLITGEETTIISEKSFIKADGSEVFAEITRSMLSIDDKDYIVSISKDITKTFQVQEALRQSELKFRTIFDNSPMGITIAHLGTETVTEINQGALDALGLTKEEFFNLQKSNILSKKTNISKDEVITKRLLNGDIKAIRTKKQFKKSDGSEFVAELTRSIINIDDDDYVVTVSKDITADIMIERERKARYQEMQTFFDALPIAFLHLDTENKVLRGNRISLGEKPEMYEGKSISALFPMISNEYLSVNTKAIETGNTILNQIEHYQFDEEVWVRVDRIPVKDDNGNVNGLIIFSTDITAVKKAEGELAVKNAELEHYIETNLQLESFAYIASHDLKEPLRMIHSFTQLLNRRLKPHFDENTTDYINFILSGVHRMQNLLDDLLKYSTIGRKEKDLEMVDLNDTIYNVIQNLQHSVKEKNAEIQIEPLPQVKAFPIQMVQLFQNLISNAIKFVPNEKQPIINIKVKEQLNSYDFEVNDNGIGIQKEYLEKIFLVFKRLHSKEEYEGTGIGLATCKKIIENLNGQIWVESEYGKGTSFFFTIPK